MIYAIADYNERSKCMSENNAKSGQTDEQLLRETPQAVGYRIRQKREGQGISLTEAASAIGISRSYLSMIEKGHRRLCRTDTVEAISSALNISSEYILHGRDDTLRENPRIDHRYYQLIQFDHFLGDCSTKEIDFCLDMCRRMVKELRAAASGSYERLE